VDVYALTERHIHVRAHFLFKKRTCKSQEVSRQSDTQTPEGTYCPQNPGVKANLRALLVHMASEILYSAGKNDECYTPDYGVIPILCYIPRGAVIWCPFDTEASAFVRLIRAAGNKVIASHIDDGKDFYNYEPKEHWDVMISNPPFTGKRKIFERALELNKPFALIMSNTWLNDAAPKQVFAEKDLQLLMFDKRMEFIQADGKVNNKITFSSSYFCYNFLPKQIVMCTLEKSLKRKSEDAEED